MKRIAENIYRIESAKVGNSYIIITEDGHLIMIDTGMPATLDVLEMELDTLHLNIEDTKQIILTHCHVDHTGNVNKIKEKSHAEIISHELEKPFLEKSRTYHYSTIGRTLLWRITDTLMPPPKIFVDRTVTEGEMIGELEVIHTPGHTPGSLALYDKKRRVLFSGDIITNEKTVKIVQDYHNVNDAEVIHSTKKLKDREIDILCVGHGEPILDNANTILQDLIS